MNVDVVIGSIWREKFEEMVVENADLQLRLSSLEKQVSGSLDKVQLSVGELNRELTSLKHCCIDDDAGSLAGRSPVTGDNSSSAGVGS